MRARRFVAGAAVALSLTFLAAGCASEGGPAGPAASEGLAVAVDVAAAPAAGAQPVALTLTNRGAEARQVLALQTPVDGIDADILDVRLDGRPVAYVGKVVKAGVPTDADLVTIAPGASVTMTFDPSTAYDMSAAGTYTVRYRVERLEVLVRPDPRAPAASARREAAVADADEVAFASQGRALAREDQARPVKESCNATQQGILASAKGNAGDISSLALGAMQGGNSTQPLYTTWFDRSGKSTYYGAVTSHYDLIAGAFAAQPVTFDCGCKKKYYAYVYPTQPYKIFLCAVFWQAPAMGRDSQAGTLVHEMSHFNVTAATNDWVYGAAGAQDLAVNDPAKATDNADNHEYFAEDQVPHP